MTQKPAAGAAAENTTKHTTNTHTTATHPAYAETNTTTTTVPPPPAHHGEAVAETEVPGATTKVITMFSYDANPDDPQEMSFAKNEVLEILDNRGQWWTARRTAADGNTTTGLVPRNYVTPI
ncbi:Transmembrane osmosensor [Rhizophlyctis rosea]|uniref:Transmembrane osmosensor n=1 Tax=Rhizophlyctis rosea TaxID=64517 RepID=A0AAD5SGU3_9FUNG|nr:Transmembrane osmosensor [Rhizophlyctis rosea]